MDTPVRKALEVEGWLSQAEAELLYELARDAADAVVEIGSYRGRSTIALALGSCAGKGGPVHAIEPHGKFVGSRGAVFGPDDRAAFLRNVLEAGVADTVRLVNLSSEIVAPGWREPVGLLWIDGDHRYETVRRDVDAWLPHLAPGGLVALHDSLDRELGPWKVVEELEQEGYARVRQVDLIALLARRRPT